MKFWLTLALMAAQGTAQTGPTLQTLYSLGWPDGWIPNTAVSGSDGVLYGTTTESSKGGGTVFSLTPPTSPGGSWSGQTLYSFYIEAPSARVLIGSGGLIYGSAAYPAGYANGGYVFELVPPAAAGRPARLGVLFTFPEDYSPSVALVASGGSLYGIAGPNDPGTGQNEVFSLTPPGSPGGAWIENVLHTFLGGSDGNLPTGLIAGPNGVLYGTTADGGPGDFGTVYSLTPPAAPGSAWTKQLLYAFSGGSEARNPWGSPAISAGGVLYGTGKWGGDLRCDGGSGCGVVFSLTPPVSPGGSWTEAVLHRFAGGDGNGAAAPFGNVLIGKAGQLYGISGSLSNGEISDAGAIWMLAPPSAGGSWTLSVLHKFTGNADGLHPVGLTLGKSGIIYGTTSDGGDTEAGSVFNLIP